MEDYREGEAPAERAQRELRTPEHDPLASFHRTSVALSAPTNSGPVGEVRRIVGSAGTEPAVAGLFGSGAEFFGIRATGQRFVFVVDCSKSMAGMRWEHATRELLSAVERLGDESYFYVVLFDAESHPMFGPGALEDDLLLATPENLDRLRGWLSSVSLGYGTKPLKSIRFALSLRPDVIYLLTDGEFNDPTAAYLRRNNMVHEPDRLKIPGAVVNTIGFHSVESQAVLQRTAGENGGIYQFVAP